MLHKFLEPGDWFLPKRWGYGAGLPIAWQGWVLLIAYCTVATGLALLPAAIEPLAGWAIFAAGLPIATILFLVIVKRRTRGGWRWRNGKDN